MGYPAIKTENLGKRYTIGTASARYGRLSESLWNAVRHPLRREGGTSTIWALKDVSIDISNGEVVGIIGRNGAGKTTLLKILSGITEPTAGRARLRGRVGSLLEVGAGFHPELTGRENIFLNGAILGMPAAEIRRKFDEIAAFAEVEEFLDTPVKRYSSGMYVRLAFAVAAHLETEVLIVDEVLAVGDIAFQKKCMGKMGDAATTGRTILFVSHNMGAIRALCSRAVLLEGGQVAFDGDASDAITEYLGKTDEAGGRIFWTRDDSAAPATEEVALRGIQLLAPHGKPQGTHEADKPIDVEIYYEVLRPLRGARVVIALLTPEGEIAFETTDHNQRIAEEEPGLYRTTCTIPARILNRRGYVLRLAIDIPGVRVLLPLTDYLSLSVGGVGNQGSEFSEQQWPGIVCPACDWKVERLSDLDDLPAGLDVS